MASLKVRLVLEYHDAPLGRLSASNRAVAQRVFMEYMPSKTGLVRRIAWSDHCRWVSTPRWARQSWKVTLTCQRLTNHPRMSMGSAVMSVQKNAWGSRSPAGSRTST